LIMAENNKGIVVKVSGPLVLAEGLPEARMYDVVRVGEAGLIGEIVGLSGERASIQVYEETGGLGPGEPVVDTGMPLNVELGPGLIESIYDGIQRPLDALYRREGAFMQRGSNVPGLDREKRWAFTPTVEEGTEVGPGDIIGEVPETGVVTHRVMVPHGMRGTIKGLKEGAFTVDEPLATLEDEDGEERTLTLMQRWAVREPRPVGKRLAPDHVLVTGQRVIDTFFPIAKGGTACVPGPFGSGKTVVQHQLAKWVDADIVIYIGCGERGNEMTDVLREFPKLEDPRTGEPLMKRSVLVANTSNMPVAAREASVYTGMTIAEYFRDMGYTVALMADSTSRWAEAMREMSTRLEEMPAEEGYPAYLGSRIASFYERAGHALCMGNPERRGSLAVIGAVSPPGGDLSDPVVQNTLRVVKVFWSLQAELAYQRHFPAIGWLASYSFYKPYLMANFEDETQGREMGEYIGRAMALLQRESDLREIVRLVGVEALSAQDRLALDGARMIREDYLMQFAFHEVDTYTSLNKQYEMLKTMIHFHEVATGAVEQGKDLDAIFALEVRAHIARAKTVPEEDVGKIAALRGTIDEQMRSLPRRGK